MRSEGYGSQDNALEHGVSGTKSALSALKLLSLTVFSDRICPVDECDYILLENTPLCTHFMHIHTNLPADYTPDLLTNLILSIGDYPDKFHELTSLSYSFVSHFPF